MASLGSNVVVNIKADASQFDVGMHRAKKATKDFETQTKKTNGTLRMMRGGFGQVGHQIQDVAVQLQMGQNAMLVFGQQGSQIASLFGPRGAMIGAVLAVGAALSMALLPRLFGATEAMKEVEDEIKNLVDNFDNLGHAARQVALQQAATKIEEYEYAIAKSNKEILHQQMLLRHLAFQTNISEEQVQKIIQTIEKEAAAIEIANGAIDTLRTKTDDTTTAFQKQDEALKKQIRTFGLEGHALRVAGIEADLLAGKIKDGEDKKLIARSEALAKLEEQAAREKEIINEVAEEQKKAAKVASDAIKAKEKAARQFADGFASSFTNAITTAENFKDAMRMVAKSVVDSLIKMIIQKQIADAIFNMIPGHLGGGGASKTRAPDIPQASLQSAAEAALPIPDLVHSFNFDNLENLEGGGFTGNGARTGGLDGKGGFLSILHPQETVVDHAKGQSMGGVVVNQTINISTGVQQTVRAEIQNLMPQITDATKSAVANARMRGGNFSKSLVGV